ncbi:MAG: hypothetical protein H6507_10310 [Calditrichaeota bacterium]|nr:hypothetical protein [Calditrichota bacterium]
MSVPFSTMIRPSDSWHITHVPEPLNNVVSSDGRFCAFPADVTAKSKKIKIRIKFDLNMIQSIRVSVQLSNPVAAMRG